MRHYTHSIKQEYTSRRGYAGCAGWMVGGAGHGPCQQEDKHCLPRPSHPRQPSPHSRGTQPDIQMYLAKKTYIQKKSAVNICTMKSVFFKRK